MLCCVAKPSGLEYEQVTKSCKCGNEPLGSIKCDENLLASQEGICSMDLITEQNLLTMNRGALIKRKAIYDEDFSNIHNDRWRKSNFVKSTLDKRQPPVIPTATCLGIKIKIL
jgi:hypothetical protein